MYNYVYVHRIFDIIKSEYIFPLLSFDFLFGQFSKTPIKTPLEAAIGQKGGFQTGFDTGSYFEIGTSLEDLYFQRFRTTQLGGDGGGG